MTGVDVRLEHARQAYERSVFGGDAEGLPLAERELDAVEADLALARGRLRHARFLNDGTDDPEEVDLFARAADLYHGLGDARSEAEAAFWMGCYYQVVHGEHEAAGPVLERARELAVRVDDRLTLSYVHRHLGLSEHANGRLDAAREHLEESTRLRRELGFQPGIAANLVGLAYLAAEDGRRPDALALLDEAEELAKASHANGVLRTVRHARASIEG